MLLGGRRGGLVAAGFCAALMTCTLTLSPAAAQPVVPSTADPGQLTDQQDDQPRELSPADQIIEIPDFGLDPVIVDDGTRFVLADIEIDGVTVYDTEDLAPFVEGFIGRMVSFADLAGIAQSLTLKYRNDGFILSRVILPAQEVTGGIVRMLAIEGRIGTIEIFGEFQDRDNLIGRMANRITEARPVNTTDLERYLLLIDDLPGIRARSAVRATGELGVSRLLVFIEQDRFEGSFSLDNRGSRSFGPFRITAVGAFNSPIGRHQRTTLRGIFTALVGQTREMRFGEAMHEFQVGDEGIRIRLRAATTHTHPGGLLRHLNIEGNSWLAEARMTYPLIRTRMFNVNILGGLGSRHSDSYVANLLVSDDRIRHIWGGVRIDFTDQLFASAVTEVEGRLVQGLDILYATEDGLGRTRGNGRHEFFRAKVDATRIENLTERIAVKISAIGQYASVPLLASEELGLGGSRFGRAFDAAQITGDHGLAGLVELRYTQQVQVTGVDSYQLYGFYDIGSIWNIDPAVGEASQESLASVGAGVRFNLAGDASGYFEVDLPLTRSVGSRGTSGRQPRLVFSFLQRF